MTPILERLFEVAMLTLELELDEDTYRPGTPVIGDLILGNAGPDPAVVKSRLAINAPLAPAAFRDVAFVVTDPAGSALEFNAWVNVGLPKARDFRDLAAGEIIVREYAIDQFYALAGPGRYTVQAVYQNQSDPPDGRAAWQGELRSNLIAFEVA